MCVCVGGFLSFVVIGVVISLLYRACFGRTAKRTMNVSRVSAHNTVRA